MKQRNNIKGVLLCGGRGTRLLPISRIINKHLLGILNKPMILYPIETLKSLGIKDILLVSGGEHLGGFIEFLGDGSEFGVNLTYRAQKDAGGIAQALGVAKDFVGNDNMVVILGDNIYGKMNFSNIDFDSKNSNLWLKEVPDAHRFGVCLFKENRLVKIIEKPKKLPSNLVVTGLYKYTPDVFDFIQEQKPSRRGEKEISDVNNWYIKQGRCGYTIIPKNVFWHDAGTPESLAEVTNWEIKNRQKNEKK